MIFECIPSKVFIDFLSNLKGQGEQLDSTVEEPTDFPMADDDFFTGTRLVAHYESSFIANDERAVSKEPPLSLQDKVENFMKYGQLDAVEGKPVKCNCIFCCIR